MARGCLAAASIAFSSLLFASACGGPRSTEAGGVPVGRSEGARPPIAAVHAQRCGMCHTPVAPGTRSRATLKAAFGRHEHERRLRLSPSEWEAMLEYLSPPVQTSSPDETAAGPVL